MRKRSVNLQGHATSVSLEDEYWAELKRMAAESAMPVGTLIERIDGARQSANLSSALRLAVLADLKAKAAGRGGERP
jgi:predicted DNA-binding ribbon-helix-helix protein